MDKSWKVFRSESGICSLENRTLEERSFYRMKVFLRNLYRNQYREEEKEEKHKSFLFSIATNLRGKDAQACETYIIEKQKELKMDCSTCSLEFYIERKRFLLTWDYVLGLVITAMDQMGNDVITSLENKLAEGESWF